MVVLGVLGILCLLYGVVIFSVHSGTPFFAVWFALGAIFLIAAWAVHAGIWGALPIVGKRAVQVIVGIVAVWLIVTQALILSGFGGTAGYDDEGDLDCIIVLGAQVRTDGPSVVLQYRLDTAYDYLVTHESTRCIVSGGQGPNEPETEASGMARYLIERGIDPSRITLEDASLNTVQNIENSRAYFDESTERVGIVTNNFHVYRACALARKQGVVHAYGIPAPSAPLYLPNNLLRESFGLTKDFLAGNL